jgi:RNA polymerase sigma-70 factor (ECF subfamily)
MAHNPADPEIDRCVQRVCAGETAAFELIVRRFQRPLRAWLAAQAPPGVDADEVAQRAFVEAFTRLADYEPGTNFAGWLFTIAAFQLKTETTRRRRVADYHARIAPELFQRALDRQEAAPEAWETRLDHLRGCVATLAAPLRQFVGWRYDDCLPLEEMASRSGRSVAAVKKQLWSIRQSLKLCVEGRVAAEGGEA